MSGLRRVVLDTSTLVSAALRVGSVPHRALAQAASVGELCVRRAGAVIGAGLGMFGRRTDQQ